MNQFFLAFEIINGTTRHTGWRIFEEDVSTSDEIANMVERRLTDIAAIFDVSPHLVMATAFNRI